ncbi:hypothetical protein BBJ28_00002174 [Nothophytophthora sp. Chile5]|nr:hypothetical protein BBJ28_00002174 [Nothophytophthora sp. Chile5]
MAGRKGDTRKRGPPARSAARKAKGGALAATMQKKKTLADKKKHVRDLAKAGRWHEVKKSSRNGLNNGGVKHSSDANVPSKQLVRFNQGQQNSSVSTTLKVWGKGAVNARH